MDSEELSVEVTIPEELAVDTALPQSPVAECQTFNWFKGEKGDKGDTGNTGATGPTGPDGFSPTATVSKSGNTVTISITDKNGTTTTTIQDYDSSLFAGKADLDLDNLNNAGKGFITNNVMPDYANGVTVPNVAAGTWTQVTKDSFVVTYGSDPYIENYIALVSPDNGTTTYIVGSRYDDTNSATEGVSFSFLVPKGWYFTNCAEYGYTAHIYPLKGAQ